MKKIKVYVCVFIFIIFLVLMYNKFSNRENFYHIPSSQYAERLKQSSQYANLLREYGIDAADYSNNSSPRPNVNSYELKPGSVSKETSPYSFSLKSEIKTKNPSEIRKLIDILIKAYKNPSYIRQALRKIDEVSRYTDLNTEVDIRTLGLWKRILILLENGMTKNLIIDYYTTYDCLWYFIWTSRGRSIAQRLLNRGSLVGIKNSQNNKDVIEMLLNRIKKPSRCVGRWQKNFR